MRHMFLALLLSAAASAQQAARVSGRVVDQSGAPIRRASVNLFGVESYKGLTDSNGAFTLDSVASGHYALTAEAPGFAKQKYGATNPLLHECTRYDSSQPDRQRCAVRAPGTTLTLTAGQELKDLVISLEQLGSISGRLTDQDGDPVARWNVEAMQVTYEGGARQVRSILAGGSPNSDGNFTIRNLLPGRYYLYAVDFDAALPSRAGHQRKASEADLPTYFPSEADATRAAPVDVSPGAELHGIDIHLRRSRVYSIRGLVTAPTGRGPIDYQILSLSRKGVPPVDFNLANPRREFVQADGTFEIRNLEPGTYVLSGGMAITNPPAPPPPLFARGEVTISSSDVEGVTLAMAAGITLTGAVKLEDGGTIDWPRAGLTNPEGTPSGGITAPDKSGGFHSAPVLAPSTNVVHFAQLPTGTYVKSIRYGNQDAIHAPLDLTGGGGGSLDIVLSRKVATVSGDVKKPGVLVSVWPRIPEVAGGIKSVTADQDGHFEISDLGPGDYYLAAWEEIDHDLLQVPAFLARFQNEASTITVEEGARLSADAKLITRARVLAEVAKLP